MSSPENEKYGDEPLGDLPGDDKQNNSTTTQVLAVQGSPDDAKKTRRELKPRHVQMMAISGAIGTGLFATLKRAGPLGLLLGYGAFGSITWMTFNAMGEMVCYLPVDGSFITFAYRFVDPSFGFALGWLYCYNAACVVAAEITAVASMVNFWNSSINNAAWCGISLAVVFGLNLLGAKYFGEGEFVLSIFKVLLILGLLIFTLITMSGGNPQHHAFGFEYWKNPGPMVEYLTSGSLGRFAGFWSTLIQAAFAYGGPDYISNAAAECKSPRRVMPTVFKRVIVRLLVFYILGVLAVPSNDPDLGGSAPGAGSSPFVLAAVRMGIPALPHIINAVIMTSALSNGIANCFSASRSLYALALSGNAPSLLKTTTRGVPIYCVTVVCAVGALCFLSVSNSSATVFTWITNLTGSGNLLLFGLFHVIYIRWYHGMRAQGHNRKDLPYKIRGQLAMSYVALIGYFAILLTNGFSVFVKGHWSYQDFLFDYLSIVFFLVPWIGHMIWRRSFCPIPIDDIDVTTGSEEVEAQEQIPSPAANTVFGKLNAWLWG